MTNKDLSKFLALLLRHKPETIGLTLSPDGWASVEELMRLSAQKGRHFTLQQLEEVVFTNDKQRYTFSEDGLSIRANQGHSVEVDLGFEAQKPPEMLFHGTIKEFVPSILAEGLQKRNRLHVHLSKDIETAEKVGLRRGKPYILKIKALEMHEAGLAFYLSKNGVWLADEVPARFIEEMGHLN